VATASPENYRRYIEGSALAREFAKLEVLEPNGNKAIQMIESKVSWLEAQHKVYVTYEAIEAAVSMSERYMHESFLPAKAISLLEKAAVKVGGESGAVLGVEAVAAELSRLTHIKVEKVVGNEGAELLNLESRLHERMVGQEEAVATVSQSLRRARAELRDGKRPIASFLFLGPTGVGKTELAKTLAAVYFGGEEYMIRLDMSEYQAGDALAKIIGADGQSGYLTEKVRSLPFTLVLLDELEKAHPEILNLFLQVLDDGRLTDGLGRTIDFTNTIIIATSNIGALYIQEEVKHQANLEVLKKNLIEQYLVQEMRPELVNRFDGIVVFKPLTMAEVAQIAKLILADLGRRLAEKGIALEATELGLQKLAELAYQPEFGARPLRRLIQDRIENEIANLILAGKLGRRDQVVINEGGGLEVVKARRI
jgi:ATP-dependent Clp protease ATP-binding subunit ClpA